MMAVNLALSEALYRSRHHWRYLTRHHRRRRQLAWLRMLRRFLLGEGVTS